MANFFWKNAHIPCDDKDHARGITIIGPLSTQISVSKTLRDFAFSLKDAGIPFQTFDYGDGCVTPENILPILTPRKEFRITRYDHVVEMLNSPLPDGIVPHRGRIMFWEFEHGLLEAYPIFKERSGDVIGMSDYNVRYFKQALSGIRNVHKILYPLRIENENVDTMEQVRKRLGIAVDAFVVFYNFSLDSGYHRKNPMAALRAFAKAFANTTNAFLFFKLAHTAGHEDRVQEFKSYAANHGFADRLILHNEYVSQREIFSLTNACDVYLSTHRSEGFGIGIAEAMSLGKAVVVTEYSSVTEFCHDDNSIRIPAKLVPIKPSEYEHPWYRVAKEWAEPDENSIAEALKRLYQNTELRTQLGQRAQTFIRDYFSIENFRKSVLAYLSATTTS